MKLLFILPLIVFTSAFGQSFAIDPAIADSVSPQNYVFTVSGTADFNDSMTVVIELTSLDSIPVIYFTGTKDFSNPDSTTLGNFTYDTLSHAFSVNIGTYPTLEMYLIVRSIVGGDVREQLIINRFEAIPNEE